MSQTYRIDKRPFKVTHLMDRKMTMKKGTQAFIVQVWHFEKAKWNEGNKGKLINLSYWKFYARGHYGDFWFPATYSDTYIEHQRVAENW